MTDKVLHVHPLPNLEFVGCLKLNIVSSVTVPAKADSTAIYMALRQEIMEIVQQAGHNVTEWEVMWFGKESRSQPVTFDKLNQLRDGTILWYSLRPHGTFQNQQLQQMPTQPQTQHQPKAPISNTQTQTSTSSNSKRKAKTKSNVKIVKHRKKTKVTHKKKGDTAPKGHTAAKTSSTETANIDMSGVNPVRLKNCEELFYTEKLYKKYNSLMQGMCASNILAP